MNFFHNYWIFLICPFIFGCANGIKMYYADELCSNGRTGVVTLDTTSFGSGSSAILKASRYGSYNTGVVCRVEIRVPLFHGVVAAVRKIDLRSGCSTDNVTISDSYNMGTMFCGYESNYNEYRSISSSGGMTLVFKTKSGSSIFNNQVLNDGFQFTFTSYKTAPCSFMDYRCNNGRCIAKILTCDSYNHCGDRSDQNNCGITLNVSKRPVGQIVGGILGTLFLIIALIAIIVYTRSRGRTTVTSTIHPPPPQYIPQQQPGSFPPPQYPGVYQPPQYVPGQEPYGQASNPLYK